MQPETLARYPYPSFALPVATARGTGAIGKKTLVTTYGRDARLEDVLLRLSADCALSVNRISRPGCFGAYLPDLEKKRR